jgi:hypothetical protein
MTYSRIHQRFAAKLGNSKALTNPEDFLGPNYETVLNFWRYVVSLEEETHNRINQRFFSYQPRLNLINKLCDKVLDRVRVDSLYLYLACSSLQNEAIARATYEIILMDQLLEEGYKMTFLPMFEV